MKDLFPILLCALCVICGKNFRAFAEESPSSLITKRPPQSRRQ